MQAVEALFGIKDNYAQILGVHSAKSKLCVVLQSCKRMNCQRLARFLPFDAPLDTSKPILEGFWEAAARTDSILC
jgi:hypothetical protein